MTPISPKSSRKKLSRACAGIGAACGRWTRRPHGCTGSRAISPTPISDGRGPGHAHHNGWELVRLGELSGPISPRLEKIAEVWRSGGFKVKCFDDIDQLVWEKLICNVCYSGTCTIMNSTIIQVIENVDAWACASGCARVAFAVAKARGIRLDFNDPVEYVRAFGMKIPQARPSMLLDHLAGRMSEIDAINGAIPVAAQACSVAAPWNTAVSTLVRAKERNMGVRH